ncbi:MAG: exopolyphosphatase [Candidatus Delongbacteria bacterium]|jgi:exopolyphosphatase/guanosine-5'-triphosphate,3'-diphosphate pyrophosphatase|nr:exopolyphosphatase [Candidatus Delongbacteria bacterium]
MLVAAIDIGSNAGRLLITTVYERFGRPFTDKATITRVPLRLGLDVFEKGYISEAKIQKIIKTIRAYQLLIDVYEPVMSRACATAAMREADNKNDVLKRIHDACGIDLEIIDGIEEAKIISKATNANFQLVYDDTLFIDVGGGSTEISYFSDGAFVKSKSFPIGTIRLLLDKVHSTDWYDMKQWIKSTRENNGEVNCICSGGNINKLTKLYGDIDKHSISKEQLDKAYKKLKPLSLEERINDIGLRPDRADVIVPAAEIFRKLSKWGRIPNFIAPRIGLADGLAIEMYKKHKREQLKKGQ